MASLSGIPILRSVWPIWTDYGGIYAKCAIVKCAKFI